MRIVILMAQMPASTVQTEYWSRLDDGRVVCELCPARLQAQRRGSVVFAS